VANVIRIINDGSIIMHGEHKNLIVCSLLQHFSLKTCSANVDVGPDECTIKRISKKGCLMIGLGEDFL
jgi:hypothetical protein